MHTQLQRSDQFGRANPEFRPNWAASCSKHPRNGFCEVIYLIGASPCVRGAILAGSESFGPGMVGFGSVREFVEAYKDEESACLILDLHPQDHHDYALQCELAGKACPPVIFTCGHTDIPAAVGAMKAGAVELLTRPVHSVALIEAIKSAFVLHRRLRQRRAEQAKLQERLSSLTPREREVLPLTVGGLLNKQAASVLGISEVTLQIHRSQVMRKMQAESLADLVRMSVKLRIPYRREGPGGVSRKFS